MKGRESGMPAEESWAGFFDGDAVMERILDGRSIDGDAVDFGCGYGTFTIPAAMRTRGTLTALDIDSGMVQTVAIKAVKLALTNIRTLVKDFVGEGTGLPAASQAHAMIFNLLHIEDPIRLLREARRILKDGGVVSVMHWRSDIPTPRGPPLSMRPTPEQCRNWLHEAGFAAVTPVNLTDACPYHFALIAS
jgi:ubiquinone/menaquinone biosynthesis C-methylase UbiE